MNATQTMEAVHKDVPICKDHDGVTAILDLCWLVMAGLAKVELILQASLLC